MQVFQLGMTVTTTFLKMESSEPCRLLTWASHMSGTYHSPFPTRTLSQEETRNLKTNEKILILYFHFVSALWVRVPSPCHLKSFHCSDGSSWSPVSFV